jgi:hypothetical protein
MNDIDLFLKWQESPLKWVCDIFKLRPQGVKPEYQLQYDQAIKDCRFQDFKKGWFLPFTKGEEVTWQQLAILLSVEAAITKRSQNRISIRSGHGIGKSTTLSWLLLWFLFCFKDAQIPCTAPTSDQIHDILWKEVQIWLNKMPKEIKQLYDWSSDYIRMIESPQTWFARARTARKESPEALAGIHADHVLYLVDEGSGVPDEIYNTGEGALTGGFFLFVMISNPTRLLGYFHDSHTKDKDNWQCLAFNSEESPIVNEKYVQRIIDKHGMNSDEYLVRVKGEFPREDSMDDGGYLPLLLEQDLRIIIDGEFVGRKRLGVDPAGEGSDTTSWVVRDNYKAKIVAREKISNSKSIAQKTRTLMEHYGVEQEDVTVDNFGEGANVAQELALVGVKVNALNVGERINKEEEEAAKTSGDKLFLNKRAASYWSLRRWLRSGGELVQNTAWKDEALNIKYRTEVSGRIKIMSKRDMKKQGIKSPNNLDALMLTFVDGEYIDDIAYNNEDEDEEYEPMYPSVNI